MATHTNGAFVAAATVTTRAAHLGATAQCARRAWTCGSSTWRRARATHRPCVGRAWTRSTRRSVTGQLPGNIEDIPLEPIPPRPLELPSYWSRAGVYGVYAASGELQYVAATRDVRAAIDGHRDNIVGSGDGGVDDGRVAMVRMMTVDDADSSPIDEVAETWTMTMAQIGKLPPGNSDDAPEWRVEARPRPVTDVRFAGSRLGPESEIKRILRAHDVVLFMKGTRAQPRCGFSKHVVDVLARTAGDEAFVCVDCLDEANNPGLRAGIKDFSNWPTIPQLYINGDFVGGADIVSEMEANGELAATLAG